MVLLYSERHFTYTFNHVTLQIAVISLYLCQIHVDMKRSLPKCNYVSANINTMINNKFNSQLQWLLLNT